MPQAPADARRADVGLPAPPPNPTASRAFGAGQVRQVEEPRCFPGLGKDLGSGARRFGRVRNRPTAGSGEAVHLPPAPSACLSPRARQILVPRPPSGPRGGFLVSSDLGLVQGLPALDLRPRLAGRPQIRRCSGPGSGYPRSRSRFQPPGSPRVSGAKTSWRVPGPDDDAAAAEDLHGGKVAGGAVDGAVLADGAVDRCHSTRARSVGSAEIRSASDSAKQD